MTPSPEELEAIGAAMAELADRSAQYHEADAQHSEAQQRLFDARRGVTQARADLYMLTTNWADPLVANGPPEKESEHAS